jgi:hypothetical protein
LYFHDTGDYFFVGNNDTGINNTDDKTVATTVYQLVFISKGTSSKNHCISGNSNPAASQLNKKKLPVSKSLSFIASVVDTCV